MAFARFMSSPVGRALRMFVGLAFILVGLALQSPIGWVLAVLGLVPLAAGAFNLCLLAPLLGAPFSGRGLHP